MRCKALVTSQFFLGALLMFAPHTFAQSASTDVMSEGQSYLEFGLNTHIEPHRDGGYQTYTSRFVRGLRRGLEAGVNVEVSQPLVADQGVELQPNLKWQFHNSETRGTAASFGIMLFVPTLRRKGTDTFGMIYGNFSKQIKGRFGPRLSAGAYSLWGRARGYGARLGPTLSYEQPLHRKVSFATGWTGGNNRFGFVTPSFTLTLSPKSQLSIGYGIGNEGRKNNELAVSYGLQF